MSERPVWNREALISLDRANNRVKPTCRLLDRSTLGLVLCVLCKDESTNPFKDHSVSPAACH